MIVFSVYNSLPAPLRYRLKQLFRTAGHSASWCDSLIARRDAHGKKALSHSLDHMLRLLEIGGVESLRGMRTMDFGSGYVPTDAVAHWLLGAEAAYAADYNAIADFSALRVAVMRDDERALVGKVPVALHEEFCSRLRALRRLDTWSAAEFRKFGIHYLAPFDALGDRPPVAFDLITSTSVLEHIAADDLDRMLAALGSALAEHGRMIHEIHLEDHLDIDGDPFNFLRRGTTYRRGRDHDARGNRVLRRDWRGHFSQLGCCVSTEAEVRFTQETRLPVMDALLPQYRELRGDELFASHVVYVSQKLRTPLAAVD
ncbi:MAG TPA: hypothetical protein VGE69_12155 [Pseudomonadales bacterium]